MARSICRNPEDCVFKVHQSEPQPKSEPESESESVAKAVKDWRIAMDVVSRQIAKVRDGLASTNAALAGTNYEAAVTNTKIRDLQTHDDRLHYRINERCNEIAALAKKMVYQEDRLACLERLSLEGDTRIANLKARITNLSARVAKEIETLAEKVVRQEDHVAKLKKATPGDNIHPSSLEARIASLERAVTDGKQRIFVLEKMALGDGRRFAMLDRVAAEGGQRVAKLETQVAYLVNLHTGNLSEDSP